MKGRSSKFTIFFVAYRLSKIFLNCLYIYSYVYTLFGPSDFKSSLDSCSLHSSYIAIYPKFLQVLRWVIIFTLTLQIHLKFILIHVVRNGSQFIFILNGYPIVPIIIIKVTTLFQSPDIP
jgi:hypothetical protein